jgi:glycosyltransferase involved in cell wall biosynthesis
MISILTVTLNAQKDLPRLVESIRSQSKTSAFEWIVVDGASTDGTKEILRSAGDVVTHWISEPDKGFYDALNKAVILCKTPYYIVMGADDFFCRDGFVGLETLVRSRPMVDLFLTSVIKGDNIRRSHRPTAVRQVVGWAAYISSHSGGVVIKRALHNTVGLYSLRYPLLADGFFLKKSITSGAAIEIAEKSYCVFAEGGMSSQNAYRIIAETWLIQIHLGENPFVQTILLIARLIQKSLKKRGDEN